MTLMGKILTVLIFILSVLFMSFSVCVYATHRNWKEFAKVSQQKVTEQTQINDQLRKTLDELQRKLAQERVARRVALAVLESRSALRQNQLVQQRNQITNLTDQERDQRKKLEVLVQELTKLTVDNSALRVTVVKVRQSRNLQFDEAQKATDDVNRLQGELLAFKTRNGDLAFLVARNRSILDKLNINPASLTNVPPALDGKVKVVSSRNLVEISLGSDDGLKVGHRLDVHRDNGTYVGRIEIRSIEPDRAVGEVMKDYRQTPVKTNDRVVTRKS